MASGARKDEQTVKDTRAKDVQEFFERVVTDWDTMRLAYYDERVIERMASVSGVDAGTTVADVGTGMGFVAAGVAPRVKRIIRIENASAMLEVARDNLRALGVFNVDLLVGDIAELPLDGYSVDAAFANMGMQHTEDPSTILREMARLTRPGGTVAVVHETEHSRPRRFCRRSSGWRGWCSSLVS